MSEDNERPASNVENPSRRKRKALKQKRLKAEHCIIVEPRSMRTAIGGTTVGNFMEWFDFGVYGYLAVTMTSVFTEGMDRQMGAPRHPARVRSLVPRPSTRRHGARTPR
ncbi:MAG: hypothetical protein L0H69_07185 [Brevibacterium sp.]|nr:hypothetical protein [Brevibacterium sp.]MDN5876444.1 hypothetical protein [Brevibacterium sp.]